MPKREAVGDLKTVLRELGVLRAEELHLKRLEQSHILRVLRACKGCRTLAAAALGIPRRTLQRKLLGVDRARLQGLLPQGGASARFGSRGAMRRIDAARVLSLRERGLTWSAIGDTLGCSIFGARLAAQRALARR
jgi:hypothetical protein